MNKTIKNFDKLPLDNAAKIYPAAMTKTWNAVYAVSAHLSETVDVNALKKAVKDLVPRFPSIYRKLEKGFFWNYLVPANDLDIVSVDTGSPCRPMEIKNTDKPLFRVKYSLSEIRVEFFHSVTDGTGAYEYLKALLLQYFNNRNIIIKDTENIKTINEQFDENELTDEFLNIYQKGVRQARKDDDAYQLELKKEDGYLSRSEICLPINQLKEVSKKVYNCTVTQYVSTVYALAILNQYKKDTDNNKPVKLSIPVNMRHFYPSNTMRNFSSYVTINVTPSGNYTFEKVLALIKSEMNEKITKDNLFKGICQNVADEKMFIAQYSPVDIKQFFMRQAFNMCGEKKYTSTVTSIGFIKLPKEMEDRVRFFSATLGESTKNRINCAVTGYRNTLAVTISSVSRDRSIENFFMNFVKTQGITPELSSDFNSFELKNKNIAV